MHEPTQDDSRENLPESTIQPRSRFSIIWLVPLIAILVGAWIAYKAWSEIGPTIVITFKTAEGLEAGKTKIKYKNVEIGQVSTIHLNHATKDVEVIAEMNKDFTLFLTDQTRFWVVSARIGASGVSGLETLLSGAYIGVDPSSDGTQTRQYMGLDDPPVVTRNVPGKHFILQAKNLGSIDRDVPVYYRKFNVGRVEEVKLNDDGESISVHIFIRSPFDQWVNNTSKFWNASGIDFSTDANGVKMDTESLVSILIGGIAFESHHQDQAVIPAHNNSEFILYENRAASLATNYQTGFKYIISFSESVRGLAVGAPIEFRGIQLGEVTDIQLSYDTSAHNITVPVTVMIQYGRIALKGNFKTPEQLYATHEQHTDILIKQGLRAQLQTGNLITGQLYIEFDFFPDAPPFDINWQAKIPEFPSMPGTLGIIEHDITSILKKVNATMTQVKELSYKLNHTVVPELSGTLKQTENSLIAIEDTLKNDSPLQQDLHITLRELAKAARSIKSLTDYLERHPESLLEGKKGN